MKHAMYINLLGHCNKCDHFMTRNVEVGLDEEKLTPCECPECHEGTVYFERLAVHHGPGRPNNTPSLLRAGKKAFRRTRSVFQWGMLTISAFVMLFSGLIFRYGNMLSPFWKHLLIACAVLFLIALWLLLNILYDRAAASEWESPHAFLPGEVENNVNTTHLSRILAQIRRVLRKMTSQMQNIFANRTKEFPPK